MDDSHIIVSCDWKNPADLVADLVKLLPKLGLFAYEANDGSDSYTVLISKNKLTKKEVKKLVDQEFGWDEDE